MRQRTSSYEADFGCTCAVRSDSSAACTPAAILSRAVWVDCGDDRLAVPAVRLDAAQTPLRRTSSGRGHERGDERCGGWGTSARVDLRVGRACDLADARVAGKKNHRHSLQRGTVRVREVLWHMPLSVILFHRVVLVCDSGLFGCEAGPW